MDDDGELIQKIPVLESRTQDTGFKVCKTTVKSRIMKNSLNVLVNQSRTLRYKE